MAQFPFDDSLRQSLRELQKMAGFTSQFDAIRKSMELSMPHHSITQISRALADTSFLNQIKFPPSPLDAISKSMELARPFTAIAQMGNIMLGFDTFSQIANFTSPFDEIRKSMARAQPFAGLGQASEFLRHLELSADLYKNAHGDLDKFYDAFTPGIISEVEDLFETEEESITEDDFDRICQKLIAHFKQLPKTWANYQGAFNTILSILFFAISLHIALQPNQETMQKLEQISSGQQEFKQEIIEELQQNSKFLKKGLNNLTFELEKIKPTLDDETDKIYYIVLKTVYLRAKPKKRSDSIAILYPNQLVELHQTNKKWIYVAYYDQLSGVPQTGWVYKKYLKRRTPSN